MGLTLLFGLACANAQIINQTNYPWNALDAQNLSIASKRCKTLYKFSPCLKVFIKRDKQDYSAICGRSEEFTFLINNS